MKPLRILLVSNRCPPDFDGGYELRAFQIAKALRARGHDLDLVTSNYLPTYKGERENLDWVHRVFRYVLVSKYKGLWRKVDRVIRRIQCTKVAEENVPAMEQFLAQRPKYDIAYVFGLHRVSLALMEPVVRRGIPVLWHAGDSYLAEHLKFWPKTVRGYRASMELFAKKWYDLEKRLDYRNVAFVSEYLRDYCKELGLEPRNAIVISRGVDFPIEDGVDRVRAEPPTFFLACRIDRQKGIHHAISAAGLLRRKRPELNWRIEIAGASYDRYIDELKEQIAKEGITDRIAFLGLVARKDVLDRMRSAVAFISSATYGEPFAGTIIETLGIGTPLIGSSAGSILEVVTPDKSALVYEREDFARLAEHMERVIDDSTLRSNLIREGNEVIRQRYTQDRIIDQTEEAMVKILNDPALSGPLSI